MEFISADIARESFYIPPSPSEWPFPKKTTGPVSLIDLAAYDSYGEAISGITKHLHRHLMELSYQTRQTSRYKQPHK